MAKGLANKIFGGFNPSNSAFTMNIPPNLGHIRYYLNIDDENVVSPFNILNCLI
jgi:hypothetical protein